MPKYYVICGDLRYVCDAENQLEAALRAFKSVKTTVKVSGIVWVNERGWIELDSNGEPTEDDMFFNLDTIKENL